VEDENPGRELAQSASTPSPVAPPDAVAAIDRQLARASLSKAEEWVRLRGEVIRQDNWGDDQRHIRRGQMIGLVAAIGLRFSALGVGVGLILADFLAPGLVALGASIYPLAPEFITRMTRTILGARGDE
jgi:hypothetical protein